MNENEPLRQQMWDLVYGLLEPHEIAALHARIKSDPWAARAYAEVRLQADLVASAAKVEDPSFAPSVSGATGKVHPPAKKPAAARRTALANSTSGGMNWLAGMSAAALAVLIGYGLLARPATRELASHYLVAEVQTPTHMSAGLTSRVQIRTHDAADNARSANLYVSLVDREGQEQLYREFETNDAGAAEIELPGPALQPGVKLEVGAREVAAGQQAESSTPAQRGSPLLQATLPVQAEPVATYRVFEKPVYEPDDTVRYADISVSRFSRQWFAAEASQVEPASDRESELSAGKAQAATAQPAAEKLAMRKEARSAAVQAEGLEAKPQAGTLSRLRRGPAPADKATMPPATPVPSNSLRLKQAESTLADLEQAKPTSGQTAPAAATAAGLATGSGEVAGSRGLDRGAKPLGAVSPSAVPISIAAGMPLEIDVPTELAQRKLLVAATCQGVIVAGKQFEPATLHDTHAAAENAPRVTLPLPDEVAGEITVKFYDNTREPPTLLAERVVYREPQRRWNVEIAESQLAYQPGERVRLTFQVTDEAGRPRLAELGIRVWNADFVGEPPAEADAAQLKRFDRQAAGSQIAARRTSGAANDPDVAAATPYFDQTKKLLGTEGESAPAAVPGKPTLDRSGEAETAASAVVLPNLVAPHITDNRAEVLAAYQAEVAAGERAVQMRYAMLGQICLLAGAAVLLLVGLPFLLRMRAEWKLLVPAVGMAVASLVAGVIWFNPAENLIAQRSQPSAADSAASEVQIAKIVEPLAEPPSEAPAGRLTAPATQAAAPMSEGQQFSAPLAASPAPTSAPAAAEKPNAALEAAMPNPPEQALESEQPLARKRALPKQESGSANAGEKAQPLAAPAIVRAPGGPRIASRSQGFAPAKKANVQPLAAKQQPDSTPQQAAPSSLFWNPQLTTDAAGQAVIEFTMPAVASDYRILIDAYGNGRLGSHQAVIQCRPSENR